MKLVRFGAQGEERPGVWLEPEATGDAPFILDVRAMAYDIEDYNAHFFAHHGLARVAALLREPSLKRVPAAGMRLGPPIAAPGTIMALGKNYADHAREFDSQVPSSPIVFSKAAASLKGPFDPVVLPDGAHCVDGEVELAVVIGRAARRVSESQALEYVAGYAVLNDVTDRTAQRQVSQWFLGKSPDTFCPLGPFLVTRDEVPDPHALRLQARLNGQGLQDGTTADMIFKIPYLIAFLSATITLRPGDILATGTPAGVGSARQPPVYLKPGDRMEYSVEGLGVQRNLVTGPA